MDTKNYTQVLIDGKIYTLGGSEDEAYLQKAASYVNEKITTMHALPGFSKQSADYQQLMLLLQMIILRQKKLRIRWKSRETEWKKRLTA